MDREDFKKRFKAWLDKNDFGHPHKRLGIPPMIKGKDVVDVDLTAYQTLEHVRSGSRN